MRHHYFTPTSLLDQFLSHYRYSRVFRSLNQSNQTVPKRHHALDLGCGSGKFVKLLQQKGFDAKGIDVNAGDDIIAADLNAPLPIESDSVDLITSLANLEHLHNPQLNLNEIYRVLKKGGRCVLTTPSKRAKPILEFLAYRLKLIDRREIDDHKIYFDKQMLLAGFKQAGFNQIIVKHFQLGLNLHAIAIK